MLEDGETGTHHITRMFPDPLTSFATAYMVLSVCGGLGAYAAHS